jgi:invasion protein IalB
MNTKLITTVAAASLMASIWLQPSSASAQTTKTEQVQPSATQAATAVATQTQAAPTQALPDSVTETHGDWVVQCMTPNGSTEKRCAMRHSLSQAETGQNILTLVVERAADGTVAVVAKPPFGLRFADGVSLVIDDTASMKLEFLTCFPDSCLATGVHPAELFAKITPSSTALVKATVVDGSPLDINVSLKGFSAGWARLAAIQ